jgi:ribokinase
MHVAVIGHIEWTTHGRAPFIPAPGQIVHLTDPLEEPAGGGAVSAVGLARMGAETSFYTAIGSDGRSAPILQSMGVTVHGAPRDVPQTRAVTMTDPAGERTIVVTGPNLHPDADDPLPWGALADVDGVYFTGLDPRTLQLARAAPVLVSTARRFESLVESGVRADVLIGSRSDPGEQFDLTRLAVQPEHVVVTDGRRGGTGYEPVDAPGPVVDTYGAGDTFAAGVTFGLAAGMPLAEALRFGAVRAAEVVTWRGAYPLREGEHGW